MKFKKKEKAVPTITVMRQYRALPETDQINLWRQNLRVAQYLKNETTGAKYRELEAAQKFKTKFLPLGVWETDYLEACQASSLVNSSDDIVAELESKKQQATEIKEINKINNKIKKHYKKLKEAKQKAQVFLENEPEDVQYCQFACSLKPEEKYVADRDPKYTKAVFFQDLKVNYFTQQARLAKRHEDSLTAKPITTMKGEVIDCSIMASGARQNAVRDAIESFDRWLTGDKNGKRSGKPHFKAKSDVTSFGSSLSGESIPVITRTWENYAELRVPKSFGGGKTIKLRYHRPLPDGAIIKGIEISVKADGWYISVTCEVPAGTSIEPPEPSLDNTVGIDPVLQEDVFIATSHNEKYEAVKAFRADEEKLAKLQKKYDAGQEKFKLLKKQEQNLECHSPEYKKLRNKLSKWSRSIKLLHQHIARVRKEHAYLVSHDLCKNEQAQHFAVENSDLTNLAANNKPKFNDEAKRYEKNGQCRKSGLAKSIYDAGFGQFRDILERTAVKYGKRMHRIDPAYTSKLLAHRDESPFKDLEDREYFDIINNLLVDRDCNAGRNMIRKLLNLFPRLDRNGTVKSGSLTEEYSEAFLAMSRILLVKKKVL